MVVETALYDHLEIAYDATADDIKRSYRKAALKWHPDRNKDDPSAAEKFKECSQSYEILSDPDRRAIYDEVGLEGVLSGVTANSQYVYRTRTARRRTQPVYDDEPAAAGEEEIYQPRRRRSGRTGSSSFQFQASWSFDFAGGSGNRATYQVRSSNDRFNNFWQDGGITDSMRCFFNGVRDGIFSRPDTRPAEHNRGRNI